MLFSRTEVAVILWVSIRWSLILWCLNNLNSLVFIFDTSKRFMKLCKLDKTFCNYFLHGVARNKWMKQCQWLHCLKSTVRFQSEWLKLQCHNFVFRSTWCYSICFSIESRRVPRRNKETVSNDYTCDCAFYSVIFRWIDFTSAEGKRKDADLFSLCQICISLYIL